MPETELDEARDTLSIREYADELAGDFYRINAEWIEQLFVMEENDRAILSDPRGMIIDRGGVILFVESAELGVIGAAALIPIGEDCHELTKMAVSEKARGRKAGEFLLRAVIERARAIGIGTLYLLTNARQKAAIHLYEKLGFEHDAGIMEAHGRRYARCDVAMLYRW